MNDSLYALGRFVAEHWLGLLVFAVAIGGAPLVLMSSMIRYPQGTMLAWAGLMMVFCLWAESITQPLTYLRSSGMWWLQGSGLFIAGGGLMVSGIRARSRLFVAFGISILLLANAGFIAPLSSVWHSLTWALAGGGMAFYIALFVMETNRKPPRKGEAFYQLPQGDEKPLPRPGLPDKRFA